MPHSLHWIKSLLKLQLLWIGKLKLSTNSITD
jgi:hypothetical protein